MAKHSDITAHRDAQYAQDKIAFEGLSPFQQKWAWRLARVSYGFRDFIVRASKTGLVVADGLFEVFLKLPYVAIGRALTELAEGAVWLAKSGVSTVAGAGRWGLATMQGALSLGFMLINTIDNRRNKDSERLETMIRQIERGKNKLYGWHASLITWAAETREKIDYVWRRAKVKLRKLGTQIKDAIDKHGALGLFRLTKWLLDPRVRNNRPLFGHERANKGFGFVLASVAFAIFSYQLAKVGVLAKVWHAELARSFFTDTAPLAVKVAKQAIIHPMITIGVTGAKFIALPIIAATRETLKGTRVARGIAFQYNTSLRSNCGKGTKPFFFEAGVLPGLSVRIHQLTESIATRPGDQKTWRLDKKRSPGALVEEFIKHVVEKADPVYYYTSAAYHERVSRLRDIFRSAGNSAKKSGSNSPDCVSKGPGEPSVS